MNNPWHIGYWHIDPTHAWDLVSRQKMPQFFISRLKFRSRLPVICSQRCYWVNHSYCQRQEWARSRRSHSFVAPKIKQAKRFLPRELLWQIEKNSFLPVPFWILVRLWNKTIVAHLELRGLDGVSQGKCLSRIVYRRPLKRQIFTFLNSLVQVQKLLIFFLPPRWKFAWKSDQGCGLDVVLVSFSLVSKYQTVTTYVKTLHGYIISGGRLVFFCPSCVFTGWLLQ